MARKASNGQKRAEKVRKRELKKKEQAKKSSEDFHVVQVRDDFGDTGDALGSEMLPDRRAIEGAMWKHVAGMTGAPDSPLARAQELMYDAFDVDDADEAIAMAREAISISPDCADAYVLLAEESETLSGAAEFYEQGVAAGRRAIGDQFDAAIGHFWSSLATRPYMRAREGLAGCLWAAGRRDEAVGHWRELLKLNPNDNQGIRYILMVRLIECGCLDELDELLRRYTENSAHWLYTRALRAFQQEGDSRAARGFAKRAIKSNDHVPRYLTGQRPLFDRPSQYAPSGEDEALIYAGDAAAAWKSVPGATTWLRKVSGVGLGDRDEPRDVPSTKRLQKLPQNRHECWKLVVHEMPREDADSNEKPLRAVAVISVEHHDFVGSDVLEETPNSNGVWSILAESMTEPVLGNPRRPGRVDFCDEELHEQLGGRLSKLGIESAVAEDAAELKECLADLSSPQAAPDDRQLDELPQTPDEVWQADCRQMGIWLPDEDGNTVRPWVVMVTCPSDDSIVAHEIKTEQPSLDQIREVIEGGMRRPAMGEPRRPRRIEVRSADQRLSLAPRLESAGVPCDARNDLDHWDHVYGGLARSMEGPRRVGPLVELPGVDPALLGSFFEAAADFFRSAPWRRTPTDSCIDVVCELSAKPWVAVVIGQNGQALGLAMYEEGRGLQASMREPSSPEDALKDASALSLIFGEQHEVSPADLDAAEQFGWPVAAPEAYPVVYRILPGKGVTSPTAADLRLLEAALRAVPQFVASRTPSLAVTVQVAGRAVSVELTQNRL